MIDFTNCKALENLSYGGANGSKRCIEYNGEYYMLKFPPVAKLNENLEYSSGCICEYLGSHIFNAIGIKAQDTLLGNFT